MIGSKGWLLLTLAFIVLLVLLNLSTIEERTPSPLLGKAADEKFDYAMKNVVRHQFDETGIIASTLKAASLSHYPRRQLIKLENPSIDFKVSDTIWFLNANHGELSEASDELILTELVTITNYAPSQQPINNPATILIEINELLFNLKERLAFSHNSVKFTSNDWQLQGKGLMIDIDKQTLKILNRIEAVHAIP